ncbi:MAG TPA: PP2C family protein-serine/threonine phosphatase [Thermoanaerobaculia bacterium]|jgi:serine phosphatase RsbU (regulator of sigma subunit)|nr:PP2C family protein-serine/threonine phosphatase [Thermoanaerobaculia bacterium]
MKALSIEELVQLPEPLALQRHFDARNYRTFRWLLALVICLTIPGTIEAFTTRRFVVAALVLANLFTVVALIFVRRERFYSLWFRQILLGFFFVEMVVGKVATLDGEALPLFIFLAYVLIAFRLRHIEHLMIYGTLWVVAVLPLDRSGLPSASALPEGGDVAGLTVNVAITLVLAMVLSQVEKRRFLVVWRTEHGRSRERLRMREEIEYARKIQLSMLPQLPPDIGWVELAAASLPATEVGGDYYDYFRLSPAQLVLVIGDVSGHGLASGLLLSGVRSCLYLLEKDLAKPVEVLDRLNQMVRKTTDRRTYVTLLCAVLDRSAEGMTLTVASAGHPPVLHYDSKTKAFAEIGEGAPPLGTMLDGSYRQVEHRVRRGDFLVLYTDGLVESRNAFGQDYGYPRLQKTVARAAAGTSSVREIRDSILGDLSHFKGDAEQADDITVVVARVK